MILLLSYLLGSVPTGYIVTKMLTGKDIREVGSGNVGGLNTFRVVSRKHGLWIGLLFGLLVALIDSVKAIVSYLLALRYDPSMSLLAPFFAILGHNFPIWLQFRGGRGIAALFGLMLFVCPLCLVVFLTIQGLIFLITQRFSPGAILALLLTLPITYILTGATYPVLGIAEIPVWLRYKEKYDSFVKEELGVGM